MDAKKINVLETMLTNYAALKDNLTDEETEVANIVSHWNEVMSFKEFNYKVATAMGYDEIALMCNIMSERGWRTVGAVRGPGNVVHILLERPVGISHPDD